MPTAENSRFELIVYGQQTPECDQGEHLSDSKIALRLGKPMNDNFDELLP